MAMAVFLIPLGQALGAREVRLYSEQRSSEREYSSSTACNPEGKKQPGPLVLMELASPAYALALQPHVFRSYFSFGARTGTQD